MKIKALLILTFLTLGMNAQMIDDHVLIGSWELNWVDGGFFPNDNVLFEKTNAKDGQFIFHFEEGGVFSQHIRPDEMNDCMVGMFTLKNGTWALHKGVLTLCLKGDKIADYAYDYEIAYRPRLEGELLTLEVDEVRRNIQTQ